MIYITLQAGADTMFDLRSPLFLVLLIVAVPVLIFVQRRARVSTAKWRKHVTLFLRGAALLCAILALANLHQTHKEQRLAVIFLVDTSESILPTEYEEVQKQINATLTKLKPTDTFGIVSFARDTVTLLEVRQKQDQPAYISRETFTDRTAQGDATNILAALKRAINLLPDDHHKRIVLFSDGMHNAGGTPLIDYLPLLSADRIEISTHPLSPLNDAVRVVQLQLPTQVRKGQNFEIGTVIETDGSVPTFTATLYEDDRLLREFEWRLSRGRHSISLITVESLESENRRYTLRLNVTDEIPENNEGHGVVTIQDKPTILYVEADQEHSAHLKTVLEENGFAVSVILPTALPAELVDLQRNDVLILSNIAAETLSTEQMESIQNFVGDLGHGLVVIGGEHGYGPGGYTDTPLEGTLPVEMTPRERKESVAIVFVLDTSGSMANYVGTRQKIGLAIEGVRAGIRSLDTEDVAGILGFNVDVHTISELTPDHERLRQQVSRLRPTGGTTKMITAIKEAQQMLNADDAKQKHIVLLSDGKSDGSTAAFLDVAGQIADANIGITTIAIGDANQQRLTEFAEKADGRAVFVENVQQLPAILTEAVRETQRYIVQEAFQPVVITRDEPVVANLGTPPRLHGYVATSEKETAQVFIRSHKDEPILAGWHFGLGKAVAWTSDVKPAWAKPWIPWQNFGKFWGQVINWTLPAANTGSDVDLTVSMHHGLANVTLDTYTASEDSYTVHVVGPDNVSQIVELQQVTPTRYTGTFHTQARGAYIVTAERESDKRRSVKTVSLAYPAEYATFQVDTAALKTVAAATGGIYEPTPTQMAKPAGEPIHVQIPLVQTLLITAAVLFVLEMILRRFSITNRYVTAVLARFRGTTAPGTSAAGATLSTEDVPSAPEASETSMARLLAAKRRMH